MDTILQHPLTEITKEKVSLKRTLFKIRHAKVNSKNSQFEIECH